MCKRCFIIIFFYVLFGAKSFAQHIGYKQYTVNDGLPQSEIVTIFQDSKGFIWAGTKYGVARFDGYRFFNHSNENGILAAKIDCIGELSNGSILTATTYGYVLHSNNNPPLSFRFPAFRSDVKQFIWFIENRAYAMFYSKYQFIVYELTPRGLINKTLQFAYIKPCLASDDSYMLFYSSANNGFYFKNFKEGLYFVDENGCKKCYLDFETFYPGQDGFLYAAYKDETSIKQRSNSPNKSNKPAVLPPIGSLLRLEKDSYSVKLSFPAFRNSVAPPTAINRKGQIVLIDYFKQKIISFYKDKSIELKIPPFNTNLIFSDCESTIWLGTSQGMIKLFPEYFVNFLEADGVNPDLQSIVADNQGVVWMSSSLKGIQYIKNDKVVKFCDNPTYNGNSYIFYPGSNLDQFGNIHFTTTHVPEIVINKGNIRIHKAFPFQASSLFFYDDTCTKTYFYATVAGLIKKPYDSDKEEIIDIKPGPKSSNNTVSIIRYSKDELLLGGFKGLLIYDGHNFTKIPNAKHPLLPGANTMTKDFKGNIWIGNVDGIYLYQNKAFKKITNQIFNSLVLSIYAIDSTKLFIGGIGKIGFLDLKSYYEKNIVSIRCFDKQNGFLGGECQQNAVTCDNHGILWVGCSNGVVRINPAAIDLSAKVTNLFITGLYVYKDELTWDTLKYNGNQGNSVLLNYSENNIKFEFTAISNMLSENVKFSYKLEGFDKLWSTPSVDRFATYTNLKPGQYKFVVKLYDDSSFSTDCSINILVKAAFWQRWYFYLFLGILLIALTVVGVSHYLARKNRLARKKIEEERRFSKLQFKALRSQLEPHFIFNALNSIGASIYTDDKQKSYDYLQQFATLIRSTLVNAEKSFRSLDEELEFVSNYLKLEQYRFTDKFEYAISVSPEVDKKTQIPKMIIQTFADQALNHGLVQRTEKGILSIDVTLENQFLKIIICDNRKNATNRANNSVKLNNKGFEIISEYIEMLNENVEQKISIDMSDLLNKDGFKCGICTTVKIPIVLN